MDEEGRRLSAAINDDDSPRGRHFKAPPLVPALLCSQVQPVLTQLPTVVHILSRVPRRKNPPSASLRNYSSYSFELDSLLDFIHLERNAWSLTAKRRICCLDSIHMKHPGREVQDVLLLPWISNEAFVFY